MSKIELGMISESCIEKGIIMKLAEALYNKGVITEPTFTNIKREMQESQETHIGKRKKVA